jgi:hypothetical protein
MGDPLARAAVRGVGEMVRASRPAIVFASIATLGPIRTFGKAGVLRY